MFFSEIKPFCKFSAIKINDFKFCMQFTINLDCVYSTDIYSFSCIK